MITLILPYGRKISRILEKLEGDYEILVAGKPHRNFREYNIKFVEDGNLAHEMYERE